MTKRIVAWAFVIFGALEAFGSIRTIGRCFDLLFATGANGGLVSMPVAVSFAAIGSGLFISATILLVAGSVLLLQPVPAD